MTLSALISWARHCTLRLSLSPWGILNGYCQVFGGNDKMKEDTGL